MLTPDILELKRFYETVLGQHARVLIRQSMLKLWPAEKKESILGVGFTSPYLASYLDECELMASCMPAQQGAAYWPANRTNLVFLAHESELPIRENTMNRVLLVHSVENTDQLTTMLRDVWRVLTPGGRVLAIVPNRSGFWARSSRSPFGHGLPFSKAQLKDLMAQHDFTVTRNTSALFIPPTHNRLLWKVAPYLEKIGQMLRLNFGGVILMEAEKQIYAGIGVPVAERSYGKVPAGKPAMTMNQKI